MEDNENNKNDELWRVARNRTNFKIHITVYFLVNVLFWLVWSFTRDILGDLSTVWPIYTTSGWGVVIIFHYLSVYKWNKKYVQTEYEKLKKQSDKKK
jgi:hypothetical protein